MPAPRPSRPRSAVSGVVGSSPPLLGALYGSYVAGGESPEKVGEGAAAFSKLEATLNASLGLLIFEPPSGISTDCFVHLC
jgi:hypothetical protein